MINFKKDLSLVGYLLLEISLLFIWAASLVFLFYLSMTFLLNFLLPDVHIPWSEYLFNLSNKQLSYYLLAIFSAVFIAVVYRLLKREIKFDFLFKLTRKEIIMYLISALFFGHFFTGNFNPSKTLYPILLTTNIIIWLLFLPLAVVFYKDGYQLSLKSLKKGFLALWYSRENEENYGDALANSTWIRKILRILVLHLIFIVSLVFLARLVSVVVVKSYDYAVYQRKLKETLNITKVEPSKIIAGEKVSLVGHNFGWRTNPDDVLISNYGPVIVETWTEEKLDFNVPLSWEDADVSLWVVRNKTDNPPHIEYKSNTINLHITPRWVYYPTDEEINDNSLSFKLKRLIKKIRRKVELRKN